MRKSLPSARSLRRLAEMGGAFPAHCRDVILAAERLLFGGEMIAFLKLFPPDAVFESRDDFVERCKQLELFINEGQDAPPELLRSPQG